MSLVQTLIDYRDHDRFPHSPVLQTQAYPVSLLQAVTYLRALLKSLSPSMSICNANDACFSSAMQSPLLSSARWALCMVTEPGVYLFQNRTGKIWTLSMIEAQVKLTVWVKNAVFNQKHVDRMQVPSKGFATCEAHICRSIPERGIRKFCPFGSCWSQRMVGLYFDIWSSFGSLK